MGVQNHLILVDGSGFIFRAFHALPPLSRADGMPVGAVYGFCTMLFRLLSDYPGTHLGVIFDTSRRTFRHDIYPLYKSHRPDPPEDLIPQFALIRDAVRAFGVPMLEKEGFEADDLIATLTRWAQEKNWQVTIVSSDKDLMQLVKPGVSMLDTLKNRKIDEEQVIEKFGVPPCKVKDVLALAGDSSDFVPGVPGIGPKTAAELINTYGSLQGLYDRLDEIKQPKRRENLQQHQQDAFVSQRLVTLDEQVPLTITLDDLVNPPMTQGPLREFLITQGFKTLASRMTLNEPKNDLIVETPPLPKAVYRLIQTQADLDHVLKKAKTFGRMAIDTETTSLNAMTAVLVGISIAIEPGEAFYIPLNHRPEQQLSLMSSSEDFLQLDQSLVLEALKPLLADPSLLKIGQNLKYDMHVLAQHGLTIQGYDDTMVMSYALYGGQHGHGMDELAQRYLNYKTITFAEVVGTGTQKKTFDRISLDEACRYGAEDADITLQLWQFFMKGLQEQGLSRIYYDLDRPMVGILQAVEQNGIYVDSMMLKTFSAELGRALINLEADIHVLAGRPFNVASPKQLAEVLFQDLGLTAGRKGKSGQQSTGIEILEDLAAAGHDIAHPLIKWRQLSKLKSTYTDALIADINPKTGRIHTSFSMTITNTGRLSSSNPNLQNIPIRTEEGMKIRQAFRAPKGTMLVSMDYSQIELRLLAHMAKIPSLQEAFRAEKDIHRLTASEVFHTPLEKVSSEQRRQAKAINFGIIYGISAYGLAQQLGIRRDEAQTYINAYAEKYPGILAYMESLKEDARRQGYVTTLGGRRCYTPGIHDKNPNLRGFAERQAINAPLQGTAADIMKIAMARVATFLDQTHNHVRLLLQVHDELVFEIDHQTYESYIEPLKNIMETVMALSIPLKVDHGVGDSWAQAHG